MVRHGKHKKSFWRIGLIAGASLLWLIVRSGGKPSRLAYPCQRAAIANIHVFLLALFAPLLTQRSFGSRSKMILSRRAIVIMILLSSLLIAFESVPFTANYLPQTGLNVFVPLNLETQFAVLSENASDLFIVQNVSGPGGNMDEAVSVLLQLMEDHGLHFFKTASQPAGLIGKDDVVLIKVNCQWDQRGGTNTDLVKSLIERIVNHPDVFAGEIVISDNGQGRGSLDWTDNNAFNYSQSMKEVTEMFPSHKVSVYLWDTIGSNSVSEYSEGDFRDGYVVNSTQNQVTHVKVSYPKFRTEHGTYISFKQGVWSNASGIYDSEKLKVINVPVLKSHSGYGVTASVKHYMGVVSQPLTNTHSVIGDGALATVMVQARFPVLNVLDAIWVNANPIGNGECGPYTSYTAASFTNVIGASLDPVVLDYWMSKHVLIPAAIQKGYTSYSTLDPDYVSGPYHNYLDNSMNELKRGGHQATMKENEMNIYVATTQFTLLGDINSDLVVDIYDALLLANAYGSTPSSPNWNSQADLRSDNTIDIYDAIILAAHYGQHL